MPLTLTDEQTMIRDAASGFFADAAPVAELRRLRDTADPTGFARDVWARMAEQGLAGVLVPEAHGGSGLGLVAAGVIAEAIGRNLSASPFLSTSVLGATALGAGSAEQQAAHWPRIAAADTVIALAVDEVARHAPGHIETRAEPSGNGFRLTGAKRFVLDGHVADTLIVAARTSGDITDAGGITLFLVDARATGVTTTRTVMVDSRNAATVDLDGVQVDGADMIGDAGQGARILTRILDAGRAVLAAELLGVATESFTRTVDYLKQREQFGVKIGSFQALQHRCAHLFCELELARSVSLRALQAFDGDDERTPQFVSLAKAKVGQVARLAVNEAVQLHGGIGMTDDFDIGFFMKRMTAADATFGDGAYHGDRLATLGGW